MQRVRVEAEVAAAADGHRRARASGPSAAGTPTAARTASRITNGSPSGARWPHDGRRPAATLESTGSPPRRARRTPTSDRRDRKARGPVGRRPVGRSCPPSRPSQPRTSARNSAGDLRRDEPVPVAVRGDLVAGGADRADEVRVALARPSRGRRRSPATSARRAGRGSAACRLDARLDTGPRSPGRDAHGEAGDLEVVLHVDRQGVEHERHPSHEVRS